MKNSKVLSIITVNYNNKAGLQKTLDSILRLKVQNFEYIVIDAGSTDGSVDLILQNKAYKKRVDLFVSEKDNGIYDGINKGINLASGSLIALMHSGDTYLENALDGILDLHKQNPASVLYGALTTSKNGQFDAVWGHNANVLPREMIPHLATFVPKTLYNKYGAYNLAYPIAADYDCFLRFWHKKVSFVFTNTIICNFDLDGISQRDRSQTEKEVIDIQKKYGVYVAPSFYNQIKKRVKNALKMIAQKLKKR